MSPTSAMIFGSNLIFISIPCLPGVALRGVCILDVECVFPLPPKPPLAMVIFWPCSVRSVICSLVS